MGETENIKTSLDLLSAAFFSDEPKIAGQWARKVARFGKSAVPHISELKREEPLLSGILDGILAQIEKQELARAKNNPRAKEILPIISEMANCYKDARADDALRLEESIIPNGQTALYAIALARFSPVLSEISGILDSLEDKVKIRMRADAEQKKREGQERHSDARIGKPGDIGPISDSIPRAATIRAFETTTKKIRLLNAADGQAKRQKITLIIGRN